MREIKIRIGIDEKTNKRLIMEELGKLKIPPGIDMEMYLQGLYFNLALKHGLNISSIKKISIKNEKNTTN